MRTAARFVSAALALAFGCAVHETSPRFAANAPRDPARGYAPPAFDRARACTDWGDRGRTGGAAGAIDRDAGNDRATRDAADAMARSHVSFPETDPSKSCYVPVRYGPDGPHAEPVPSGCGYPASESSAIGARSESSARTLSQLGARADMYEAIASGTSLSPMPTELACPLSDESRRAAARTNARTLRDLAKRLPLHAPYPYAAVATFGYGFRDQRRSALLAFRPGERVLEAERT